MGRRDAALHEPGSTSCELRIKRCLLSKFSDQCFTTPPSPTAVAEGTVAHQGHGAARITQAAWTGGAVLHTAAGIGKGLFTCACVCVCVLMWSGEALTRREKRGLARKRESEREIERSTGNIRA